MFALDILINLGFFVLLAIGLDLIVGFTGILSIGHAAFYAVGAYVAAIAAKSFGLAFVPASVLSILAAALIAMLAATPIFRVSGDFILLVTLGLGGVIQEILLNWTEVTGGPKGIRDIPPMSIFGWTAGEVGFFAIEWAIVVLVIVLAIIVKRSRWGLQLKGVRDDEIAMEVLGYPVARIKVLAFASGGALAGLAGSLFAHYRAYISPTSFGLDTSVLVFCMCIIGGLGTVWGAVAGATLFWCLPELLRLVGESTIDSASVRQLCLGIILILIMIYKPAGILGERRAGS